jgi:hypothetical protein
LFPDPALGTVPKIIEAPEDSANVDKIRRLEEAVILLKKKNKELNEDIEKRKVDDADRRRREAAKAAQAKSTAKAGAGVGKGNVEIVPGETRRPITHALPSEPAVSSMIQTDSNVLEIARAQKLRLKVAEEQIEKLRDENKQLQSALGSSSRKDVMKQVRFLFVIHSIDIPMNNLVSFA